MRSDARPTGKPSDTVHFERERGVTDVTVQPGIAHVTVQMPPERVALGRLELLKRFAAAGVPVFLVKLLPEGISFALRASQVEAGAALLSETNVTHVLRRDLGLVTIIAGAMRDLSGIMATIYDALVTEGIGVQQTGDAYNAVHCLVPGADAERAAATLRSRFALAPPAAQGNR